MILGKSLQRMKDFQANAQSRSKPSIKSVDASTGNAVAALDGKGNALRASLRARMESRFKADFTQVRIHTDSGAHALARSLDAKAFTVGRDIVFGPGHYSPETQAGERLLAHELVHVVQQGAAGGSPPVKVGTQVIQRAPETPRGAEHERHIKELALNPRDAHAEWPRLSISDRIAVVERMRRRFGSDFADQFLALATTRKSISLLTYWQPGQGPTPERLRALGYHRGGKLFATPATDIEVWVHPSGKLIYRDVSTYQPGESKDSTKSPPPKIPPVCGKIEPTAAEVAKATELLASMEDANDALETLCTREPFNEREAEDAMVDFIVAHVAVREMKCLDIGSVMPDFWKMIDEEVRRNEEARKPCCAKAGGNLLFLCPTPIDPGTIHL